MQFHQKTGNLVQLSRNRRRADRLTPSQEFNNGIVFLQSPLKDETKFEVSVEKIIRSWSGSIEIGVTIHSPESIELPNSATLFASGTWYMSGSSVIVNGETLCANYGSDLDGIEIGHTVGVMRKRTGDLHFFINGVDQGIAAENIPEKVYAFVDLYGKCVAVALVEQGDETLNVEPDLETCSHEAGDQEITSPQSDCFSRVIGGFAEINALVEDLLMQSLQTQLDCEETFPELVGQNPARSGYISLSEPPANPNGNTTERRNRIVFHDRCGSAIMLSASNRTANKLNCRTLHDFGNMVLSNRALLADELFEIRLDSVQDDLNSNATDSIQIGVTPIDPSADDEESLIRCNNTFGSIHMTDRFMVFGGCEVRREYGYVSLISLKQKDYVAVQRRSNGNLHFYINGMDQGVAARNVPDELFGFFVLQGNVQKVTVSFNCVPSAPDSLACTSLAEQILMTNIDSCYDDSTSSVSVSNTTSTPTTASICFDLLCGEQCRVMANGMLAERVNANEEFDNAVVYTNRMLRDDELFEVRVEQISTRWSGSLEIGITLNRPVKVASIPSNLASMRDGSWLMSGYSVMQDGITVLDDYCSRSLDTIEVGDRVGVMRKSSKSLHFFVNGVDQGEAFANVPDKVFGVFDLYGRTVQVSMVGYVIGGCLNNAFDHENTGPRAKFCSLVNDPENVIIVSNNGYTASRAVLLSREPDNSSFDAGTLVFADSPLIINVRFEFTLSHFGVYAKQVLRFGVTNYTPPSCDPGNDVLSPLEVMAPKNLFDLSSDRFAELGFFTLYVDAEGVQAMNRVMAKKSINLDLDKLCTGDRLGIMVDDHSCIHFFLNGLDIGQINGSFVAMGQFYAVVDLCGQCYEISVNSLDTSSRRRIVLPARTDEDLFSEEHPPWLGFPHEWARCSKNVKIDDLKRKATRSSVPEGVANSSLVFAADPFCFGEAVTIKLESSKSDRFTGCVQFGISQFEPARDATLPSSSTDLINSYSTYFLNEERSISASQLPGDRIAACAVLQALKSGDSIGLIWNEDFTVSWIVNETNLGVLWQNVIDYSSNVSNPSQKWFLFVSLFGACDTATLISQGSTQQDSDTPSSSGCIQSFPCKSTQDSSILYICDWAFHSNFCGRNVRIERRARVARRTCGYSHGIATVTQQIQVDRIYLFRIDTLNASWSGQLGIGVFECETLNEDVMSALSNSSNFFNVSVPGWFLFGSSVFRGREKTLEYYGLDTDQLKSKDVVGICVNRYRQLTFYLNGISIGVAANNLILPLCLAFDLHGKYEQISACSLLRTCSPTSPEKLKKVEKSCSILKSDEKSEKEHMKNEKTDENVQRPIMLQTPVANMCAHFDLALKVKSHFSWHDAFFDMSKSQCYCESCFLLRNENLTWFSGEGGNEITTPIGWQYFRIRQSNKNRVPNGEKWLRGLVRVSPVFVRKCLDKRAITLPSNGESVTGIQMLSSVKPTVNDGNCKLIKALQLSEKTVQTQACFFVSYSPNLIQVHSNLKHNYFGEKIDVEVAKSHPVVLKGLLLSVQ